MFDDGPWGKKLTTSGCATKIEGNTIDLSVPCMPGANFHAYTLREPFGVVNVRRQVMTGRPSGKGLPPVATLAEPANT